MSYEVFAAFAVPFLSMMTYLAYKHPSSYREISNMLFMVAGIGVVMFVAYVIGAHYASQTVWFVLVAGCIGYLIALRFLDLFMDVSHKQDGPREQHPDKPRPKDSTDD